MNEPLTIEQVKDLYFTEFDEVAWIIDHDEFKYNSILKGLKENEKCYLFNLIVTAKRYYSGSLIEFQEFGLNTDKLKEKWEKIIKELSNKLNELCR